VTPNLYGNLVSNTAAGIAGGTGVMPGGTYCFPLMFFSFWCSLCSQGMGLNNMQLSIVKNRYVLVDG
jgi:hypothetical protein